jgi:TRAP-type C4-dicarboxylate transport system substrate-binding protein
LAVGLASAAFLVPGSGVSEASADGPIVIRYASLAPPNSAFGKILKAWNRTYKKETEGRSELRFYTGGSQGDERDFIRKIRAGQIDAAGISTTGLGVIVRPILVLTAPGLITEIPQLNHVRTQLRTRFEEMFRSAGFELLTWGDGGKNRLFSAKPFARPEDLKSGRPWAWKDDPVFAEYLRVIGANPVRVGANEVYGGLQTRMIDAVPSSAIMAVAIQWYTKLNYMAKQNFNIIIGGSIIKKEVMDQLTPGDQEILLDTAERSARAMDKIVLRDDAKAYATLLQRGLTEVDLSPHQAEWDAVAKKAREQLAGRVYSKSLLEQVAKLAAGK